MQKHLFIFHILLIFNHCFFPFNTVYGQSVVEQNNHDSVFFEASDQEVLQCAQIVRSQIISIMGYLYECQTYWKKQKYNPFTYFFAKNPIKWFIGKKQTAEIEEHLTYIAQQLDTYAQKLGLLNGALQKSEETQTEHLSVIIQDLIKHHFNLPPECPQKNILVYAHSYAHYGIKQLKNHNQPSHLVRHWIEYSIVTFITMAALGYWHNNTQKIAASYQQFKNSSHLFLKNYLKEPLKRIRDIFFHRLSEDEIAILEQPSISNDVIQELEHIVVKLTIEAYKKIQYGHKSWGKEIRDIFKRSYTPEPPSSELYHIAYQAMKKRILPPALSNAYIQQSSNPAVSIASPSGTYLLLTQIQVFNKALALIDNSKKIDYVIKSNEINFQILRTVPALLAGILTGTGTYLLYKYMYPRTHSKNTIQIRLGSILCILQSVHALSEKEHGFIVYWAEIIKQSLHSLNNDLAIQLADYCDTITKQTTTQEHKVALTQQALNFINC